jgi:hypothetical protein
MEFARSVGFRQGLVKTDKNHPLRSFLNMYTNQKKTRPKIFENIPDRRPFATTMEILPTLGY